jgi:hypothetical protein
VRQIQQEAQAQRFQEQLKSAEKEIETEKDPIKRKLGSASKWTFETLVAMQVFFVPTRNPSRVIPNNYLRSTGTQMT